MSDAVLDLIRAEALVRYAARMQHFQSFAVEDRVRVLRREGSLAVVHIGDIGTVIEVQDKRRSEIVHSNAVFVVYTVRFDDGETWSFADADVQAADAPYQERTKRQRRKV